MFEIQGVSFQNFQLFMVHTLAKIKWGSYFYAYDVWWKFALEINGCSISRLYSNQNFLFHSMPFRYTKTLKSIMLEIKQQNTILYFAFLNVPCSLYNRPIGDWICEPFMHPQTTQVSWNIWLKNNLILILLDFNSR